MFFQYNNEFINLHNVSCIKFDKQNLRIIILFNYSIKLKNIKTPLNHMKTVSDYKYIDLHDEAEFDKFCELIVNAISKKGYKFKVYKDEEQFIAINFNYVTYVKFINNDTRNRLILNFNNPVTFIESHDDSQLTGYFIYIDIPDQKTYKIIQENLLDLDNTHLLLNK